MYFGLGEHITAMKVFTKKCVRVCVSVREEESERESERVKEWDQCLNMKAPLQASAREHSSSLLCRIIKMCRKVQGNISVLSVGNRA